MKILVIILALAGMLFSSVAAFSHEYTVGDLHIGHPYSRPTPPGAPVGGGYLTVRNEGSEADTLIEVRSDIAGRIEIHQMKMENDVMRMSPVEGGLPIPAGETVELVPGGYHIMFMGLNGALIEGEKNKATLVFEKAGEIEVEFSVDPVKTGSEKKKSVKGHAH